MNQELRNQREALNRGDANPDEAFERLIDALLQRPAHVPADPNCSWCDWRRGDSPRNLRLCAFHEKLRQAFQGAALGVR